MESFTAWSIQRVRSAVTILVCFVVYGLLSYKALPKSEDPGFVIKVAQVITFFPGATAERVELLVTDKLEKFVEELPEVALLESESIDGASILTVHLQQKYREVQPVWNALRRKVERAKLDLPEEAVGPFVDDEYGDTFGTLLVVKGDGFSYRELEQIANQAKNELLLIDHVAKVDLYGVKKQSIFLEMETAKISQLGSSSLQLAERLKKANIVLSGGQLQTEQERLFLEPTGNFSGIEAIGNVTLYNPKENELFFLKEIAKVVEGYEDPPQEEVYEREEPAIVLAISLQQEGNIQTMGREIRARLQELQQKYPLGVEFSLFYAQDEVVEESIDNFMLNILESCCIVVAIMLFVFGFRTGCIAASLIPLTLLITFVFMRLFSIGIDQISLASLVISLGLLVDNAIVMTEYILFNWEEKRMSLYDSAITSAKELSVPLLASSLTTSLAFLPIFLANSDVGEYTSALFKVVTITLFSSFVLSVTWVPMICFYFLKRSKKKQSAYVNIIYKVYFNILMFLFGNKTISVVIFLSLFISALVVFTSISTSFFPVKEQNLFALEVKMPSASTFTTTKEMVESLGAFMEETLMVSEKRKEGVENWLSFVGGMHPRYMLNVFPKRPGVDRAVILVKTSNYVVNAQVITKIKEFFRKAFPDAILVTREMNYGVFVESPIAYDILVKEAEDLERVGGEVKEQLKKMDGVVNIRDNLGERVKKLVVDIDPVRAQSALLTNFDVAVSLQTALSGYKATDLRQEEELIPIYFRSVEDERESLERVKHLSVFSQTNGQSVPLSQIATMRLEWVPSIIHRKNRRNVVKVLAEVDTDKNSVRRVDKMMGQYLEQQQVLWPSGTLWDYSGENYESRRAEMSVYKEIPAAFIMIAIVLILQFNSFRLSFIILSTIPLSLIGVAWGLFLTGSTYSFMSFLGIISLAGIIINNGIVLLDETKINIEEKGLSPPIAILQACQLRLRPIFLTTLTTLGGLVPLLLTGGGMFQQMSLAIISGLLFGGVLTLGFVPLLYVLLYRVSFEGVANEFK